MTGDSGDQDDGASSYNEKIHHYSENRDTLLRIAPGAPGERCGWAGSSRVCVWSERWSRTWACAWGKRRGSRGDGCDMQYLPIPDALESYRSCLQLVPVRPFPAGQRVLPVIQPTQQSQTETPSAEAFFPCRWFYTLYGQKQPRDCSPCVGCPYWFPRPPLELIPGYWPETQKMLRIVTGEERIENPPTGFRPSQETPPQTFWEKLRSKIHL